jgi:hypothetical protein
MHDISFAQGSERSLRHADMALHAAQNEESCGYRANA